MTNATAPTDAAIEHRLTTLGQSLAGAARCYRTPARFAPDRAPSRLDDATGIGKDVAYRILKAVRSEDPITTVHLLPGPAPLRRLLKAAAKHSVSPSMIDEARQAVDDFERFILSEAGDRGTLDLIIGGWLPEARQKGELLAKQAVFRGMSHVRGLSAEVLYKATILHPSHDDEHVDGATIQGLKGFRRWRRDAELRFAARRIHPPSETPGRYGSMVSRLRTCGMSSWPSFRRYRLDT